MNTKPISLYIHIPFCIHKCGYCDFNSYALETLKNKGHVTDNWAADYSKALIREINGRICRLDLTEQRINTIFFGGGTPSLFPASEIARIIDFVQEQFDVAPEVEISLEANPSSANTGHLNSLRKSGINRLSIGIQSFDNGSLRLLERIHTGDDAREAFRAARRAGFTNISIDLMFGIPFQTIEQATSDIESAMELGPEHISVYELTIEPGTKFGALHNCGRLEGLPDEDTAFAMWEIRDRYLSLGGFERYEISNFAQPGFQCQHNINYWTRGEYLGIGAGAHSLIDGQRQWNLARPDLYTSLSDNSTSGEEDVSNAENFFGESLLLGLRLREGISLKKMTQAYSTDPRDKYGDLFSDLVAQNLLELEKDIVRLSSRGTMLANQVFLKFS